jgi:hypothetical protein
MNTGCAEFKRKFRRQRVIFVILRLCAFPVVTSNFISLAVAKKKTSHTNLKLPTLI